LSRVASKFQPFESPDKVGFKSNIINEAIASLPTIAEDVATFLSSFNHTEAANDNKFDLFKDDLKYAEIEEQKMGIVAVEADLHDHLLEIRKMLKNSKLGYHTVAGVEVVLSLPC
jgi:DNA mismatch repair protein MSH3